MNEGDGAQQTAQLKETWESVQLRTGFSQINSFQLHDVKAPVPPKC